jgi:CDP-diacylglycerol--glycerol-3-phosphate 3-phosphatidyltransferase
VIWTVPNRLAAARLVLSPLLLPVAWVGRDHLFIALFLAILSTDWLDGKLAVMLDQRTEIGARLDTVADGVMYTFVLAGLFLLAGDAFVAAWPWMAAAVAAYALSWGASLAKFGQLPSYHPWSAKFAWFVALWAVLFLVAANDALLLRIATVAVALANLEAVAITLRLDRPRSDVRGVWAVPTGPEAEGASPRGDAPDGL